MLCRPPANQPGDCSIAKARRRAPGRARSRGALPSGPRPPLGRVAVAIALGIGGLVAIGAFGLDHGPRSTAATPPLPPIVPLAESRLHVDDRGRDRSSTQPVRSRLQRADGPAQRRRLARGLAADGPVDLDWDASGTRVTVTPDGPLVGRPRTTRSRSGRRPRGQRPTDGGPGPRRLPDARSDDRRGSRRQRSPARKSTVTTGFRISASTVRRDRRRPKALSDRPAAHAARSTRLAVGRRRVARSWFTPADPLARRVDVHGLRSRASSDARGSPVTAGPALAV